MLTLNDGRPELWQWDTCRKLTVDADCSQVHFSNKVFGRSIDVDVVGGVAIIPDILLQTDKELNVWAFVGTAENGYTKIGKTFKVNRRNKPADYVFTPHEQTSLEEILEKVDYLESIQDPDAIKNAVEDYLEQNPPAAYTLPIATETTLGGVKAAAATEEMTQPVGITAEGKLVTVPGQNSGGNVDLTGYAKEQWVQQNYQPVGDYALKSQIPTVPTKVSAFENDKGYLTQHQDISGLLPRSELPGVVEDALAEAKQSGAFDGTSVTVKSVTESTADGGSNVVEFSNGKTVTIKNGKAGTPGKNPEKGIDYWTPADQEAIVQQVITALGTPVFGRVKEGNKIITTGNLAAGTYEYWFEDENGKQVLIGTLDHDGQDEPTYTNVLPLATGTDGTTIFNGTGWAADKRYSQSSAAFKDASGVYCTGLIEASTGDVIRLKNITMNHNATVNDNKMVYFFQNLTCLGSTILYSPYSSSDLTDVVYDADGNMTQFTINKSDVTHISLNAGYIGTDSIITINEPIE